MNIKKKFLCGSIALFSLAGCTNLESFKDAIPFPSSNSSSSLKDDLTSSANQFLDSKQAQGTKDISSQKNSISPINEATSTTYGILADLGQLSQKPIQFDNEGWIIKVDGKYGFINPQGEIVVEPKYSDLFHMPRGSQESIGYLYNSKYDWQNDARLPNNYVASADDVPPGIGMALPDSVFLDTQGNIKYYDALGNEEISSSSYHGPVQNGGIYTVSSHDDFRVKSDPAIVDYYIYIPQFNYLEGPYAYKYIVSYTHLISRQTNSRLFNHTLGPTVTLRQDDGCGLYNLEQNAMITGFDWIEPIDYESFAAQKGDNLYIYSKDLDFLYKAKVDAATGSIGNTAMIYDDGWKVVTLDYLEKNYPTSDDWMPSKVSNVLSTQNTQITPEGIELTPGLYKTEVELKVRTKPSVHSEAIGSKSANQIIHVQEIEIDNEGLIWGKLWDNRWICLVYQGQPYCSEVSLNTLQVEDLSQVILDHYNWLLQPSGFYSVITDYNQNGPVWTGIVRYALSEEEAKEREANGLPVSANTYAFSVEVNMRNGAISDEYNLDSWNVTK